MRGIQDNTYITPEPQVGNGIQTCEDCGKSKLHLPLYTCRYCQKRICEDCLSLGGTCQFCEDELGDQ